MVTYRNPNVSEDFFGNRTALENKSRVVNRPRLVDDDIYEITILSKYQLLVDKTDKSVGYNLWRDAYWEMWITQIMPRIVHEGYKVVDAGANFGYYTMLFADLVGPEGFVLAVEPQPHLASLIKASASLNGFENVAVSNLAIGAKNETGALFVPAHKLGDASIKYDFEDSVSIPINIRKLDDIIATADFVKMDIEGAEQDAFIGMQGIIRDNQKIRILFEWVGNRISSPKSFLKWVRGFGFQIFQISEYGSIIWIEDEELLNAKDNRFFTLFLKRPDDD